MGRNAVNCISVSNAQLCQAQSNDATELIEHLPIHEIESSDGPHVCTNFRNHSCITTSDVENCLIHDQGIDNNSDILLNKYCIFNGNKTNILSRCNEGIKSDCLSILQSLSRTSIYSQQDSGDHNNYVMTSKIAACPPPLPSPIMKQKFFLKLQLCSAL